ncbi:MAG: hypothetical protein RL757_3245 [Bacteroidota bacterium]|jgi:3-oxoacyl-(acyl-carrier-protein) synthase III
MRNTIIKSLGLYLPPKSVTTKEVLKGCRNPISAHLFERLTGIYERRMAGDVEFSIDLAAKAVDRCLKQANCNPDEIDLIICCNISRFDAPKQFAFEPATAMRLRDLFQLRNARCFDVSNACAGMFTGVTVADKFLKTGSAQKVLVVSGEYITHLTRSAQIEIENLLDTRMACLTLGDAGVALLLESTDNPAVGFRAIDIFTLGAYSDLCIATDSDIKHGGAIMHTKSAQLAEIVIRQTAKHMKTVLDERQYAPTSMDYLIPHQTSTASISIGIKETNKGFQKEVFSLENTANVVSFYGNTSSTSHFVALAESIEKGRLQAGDNVLFSITASGITIGTAVYSFEQTPKALLGNKDGQDSVYQPKRCSAQQNTHKKLNIKGIGTLPKSTDTPKSIFTMADRAAQTAIENGNGNLIDIDLLLYTGVYREKFLIEPAVASIVAGSLKLNASETQSAQQQTFAFDVLNGALGFLDACSVGLEMIRSGKKQELLICTAEIENNEADSPHAPQLALEETASAMLLEASDTAGFSDFFFYQQPDFIDQYRTCLSWEKVGVSFLKIERYADLNVFYLKCISDMLKAFELETGYALTDFDYILPPQISTDFVAQFAAQTAFPAERIIDATQKRQDLFTSSIPYAFEKLYAQYSPQSGEKALVIGVGSGIQVGCSVYNF